MMLSPSVDGPAQLPDMRLWLAEQWKPGGPFAFAFDIAPPVVNHPDFYTTKLRFDPTALSGARLYYVTEEMSALIEQVSKTLPPTTLTEELVPVPSGLVWFAKTLTGTSALQGGIEDQEMHIRALLWGDAILPGHSETNVGISLYGQMEEMIYPLGRTDWIWGSDTEEPSHAVIDADRQLASMAEDRRWMATFWLLLSQTGVAQTTEMHPPRQTARRSQRANVSSDVNVVDVHAPKRSSQPSGEGREVDWQNRWIVDMHWRQQAYGPQRSLRRPTLIGPYVKGPEDRPLKIRETVHILKDKGSS